MKIAYKDIANSQSGAGKKRLPQKPFSHPLEHAELSPFNNYQERPFNKNSKNLSFEGLFYKPLVDASKQTKIFNAEEFLKITDTHMGTRARNLFENVKESKLAHKLINIDGSKVTFQKKTILKAILDGIAYPITVLPTELLNGIVGALRKFKPLKNWAEKLYASPSFKQMRQRSKIDAKVNALRGLFETIESNKKLSPEEMSSMLFKKQIKMFDSKTGSYDTKHERSLNRIVSGLIPAVFLANDAYNLSIMCDDNKEEAKHEQKIRFKQESARVITQAFLTLVTMGAIQKYINKSNVAVMLNVGLTALFTESISRLIAGKPITKISPDKAQEMNKKEAEENAYKGIPFKANKNIQANKVKEEPKVQPKKQPDKTNPKDKNKAPLMSFENLFKGIGIAIGVGYAIKGLRTNAGVEKLIKKVSDGYDKLYKKITTQQNVQLEVSKFEEIVSKLEQSGFADVGKKYRQIIKDHNLLTKDSQFINLGSKDKKVVKPVVDFLVGPFKFTWGVLKAPYYWTNKAISAITKTLPKKVVKETNELEAFKKSIDGIGKEALRKKFNPEKFADYVEINSLKAFNEDNVSGIANSDLANLSKTAVFAATLPFLMSDNYNMVMLKSNGQDTEGAELKYKERLVQESSRFFYSTLLISLFNNTFQSQYHKSLFGMSWVTAACTVVSEILNRKSVGVPVGTYSRDEIVQMEKDRENAPPLIKGYYDFMGRLTGKKSLVEQRKMKDDKKAKA